MVGSKGARKALARALAQVVLSRETILVHAESVLERADLIEGSLHSSAFNLWFAVLQRAEAEGALERLVGSVLEDNPGADPLRQALRDWQLAMAAEPAGGERQLQQAAPPSSTAEPRGARSTSEQRSERARWLALGALGLGFAALFIARALRESAAPPVSAPAAAAVRASGSAAQPQSGSTVQVGSALRARARSHEGPLPARDAGNELAPPGR